MLHEPRNTVRKFFSLLLCLSILLAGLSTGAGLMVRPAAAAAATGDVPPPGELPFHQMIGVGEGFACALQQDGSIICWGANHRGQARPPMLDGTFRFTQVSVGSFHACGLKDNGQIACWGSNVQENDGAWLGQAAPPQGDFIQVSAGGNTTCGLTREYTITCWGENQYGQATPPQGSFIQISVGEGHACGLSDDHRVSCWGLDDHEQSTPPEGEFTQVNAGFSQTCALDGAGDAMCWGANYSMGQDSPPDNKYIQIVVGEVSTCGVKRDNRAVVCWGDPLWTDPAYWTSPDEDDAFIQVSYGIMGYCGIKTDGEVTCWGHYHRRYPLNEGPFAQLGSGQNSCAFKGDHTLACWGWYPTVSWYRPIPIFLTQVSAGGDFFCGIRADNSAVQCWGDNTHGQAPSEVEGHFTWVSAGLLHACGVKEDGSLTCWGSNTDWEGNYVGQATPPEGTFTQVSAGEFHTCGLKQGGSVVCWGDNRFGQIKAPTEIFTSISAGSYHTCGLTGNGTSICWGSNRFGESTPPEELPHLPDGGQYSCQGDCLEPVRFTQISAGGLFTCGLRQDNSAVQCWGENNFGQATPPDGAFTQVSAGAAHACGLKPDGDITCWGIMVVPSLHINIFSSNHVPLVQDDAYATPEDTPLAQTAPGVLSNDSDLDSNVLSAALETAPLHGALSLSPNGSFVYTPRANYNGADSFTYKVFDGLEYSNIATVSLTVTPVNDLPVAVNDSYTTLEDTPLTIIMPGVLSNDSDVEGDQLTTSVVQDVLHGTAALKADGSFTYTPQANYFGKDQFTYQVSDGSGWSNVATVWLTILPVNNAPVAAADTYTIRRNTTLIVAKPAFGLLANDTDAESDILTVILVRAPTQGRLVLNADGTFVYAPPNGFTGTIKFSYQVSDGALLSNVVTVIITVTQ